MRRRFTRGVAAGSLTVLALGACSGGSDEPDTSGNTLTLANVLDNNSFNPQLLNIGNQAQYWSPVFDTLLIRDRDFELQPWLATDWSYNEDLTELTLTLRDDVTFSDGTPFDGEAVKANIANLAAGKGQNAYMAKSVAEVRVSSPTEVTIVLAQPDPAYLDYLASVGGVMASPASLTAPTVGVTPVGSGPYVLDRANTVVGDAYTYVRSENYWNAEEFAYDKVVIRPMSDITARLNALKSGQINGAIADNTIVEEAETSGLRVNMSMVNWVGLILADRDGVQVPALKDVRVRQAMNLAFDKEGMLEYVSEGNGQLTTQIFNQASEAYDPSLDDDYGYDPERAKELLAEAGYPDGFEFTMAEGPGFARYNAIITQYLADIGITVNWVKIPASAVIPESLSGKYPVVFMTLGSQAAWQDVQKAVTPGGAWNMLHVENPELSGLLQAAQFAPIDDGGTAMKAVSQWLVDNAWFSPWYREQSIYLTDSKTAVAASPYVVAPPVYNFTPES